MNNSLTAVVTMKARSLAATKIGRMGWSPQKTWCVSLFDLFENSLEKIHLVFVWPDTELTSETASSLRHWSK